MLALINRLTNKKFLWFGILFILIVNVIIFPFFPKLFGITDFDVGKILDLQFGFDAGYVKDLLEDLGEKGRYVYLLSTLLIDMPYAVIYGFVYAVLINFLLRNSSVKISFLMFLPLLISIFDVLENIFTVNFLLSYPEIPVRLVSYASISNRLKWLFAVLTLLTVSVLIIYIMYKSRKNPEF